MRHISDLLPVGSMYLPFDICEIYESFKAAIGTDSMAPNIREAILDYRQSKDLTRKNWLFCVSVSVNGVNSSCFLEGQSV